MVKQKSYQKLPLELVKRLRKPRNKSKVGDGTDHEKHELKNAQLVANVKELKKQFHDISVIGLMGAEIFDTQEGRDYFNTIHNIAHAIGDVLKGYTPDEAIQHFLNDTVKQMGLEDGN